jgi:hypothetical protein
VKIENVFKWVNLRVLRFNSKKKTSYLGSWTSSDSLYSMGFREYSGAMVVSPLVVYGRSRLWPTTMSRAFDCWSTLTLSRARRVVLSNWRPAPNTSSKLRQLLASLRQLKNRVTNPNLTPIVANSVECNPVNRGS